MYFSLCAAVLAVAAPSIMAGPANGAPSAAPPAAVAYSGTYYLIHHDTVPDETVPFLQVGNELFRLHFAKDPHYHVRSRVTVTGLRRGHDVTVTRSVAASTAALAATPGANGAQSVLIMRVYWASTDTVTQAQAVNQVAGTDNAFYREDSYGQLGLTATATATWLQVAAPSNCDDIGTLQTEAYNAAVAAGYDPDAYDHDMIYLSSNDCAGRSWGQIGGKWTWIQGTMNNYRTSHELGHNLGLFHSHSLACVDGGTNPVAISDSCTLNEYGDSFDTEGYPWAGENGDNHNNASQKYTLGWLTGRIQAIASNTTFALPAYESSGAGTRALLIASPKHTYFVENREAVGFDADLPPGATSGAVIHISDTVNGGSDLLDMTPTGPSTGDAALPVGGSWSDPDGIFRITVTSDGASGLVGAVAFTATSYPLTVSKAGTGTGTVTSAPAGISCGATCSAGFASGTSVTLTANPASGSTFAGWGAGCSGTALTCVVSMTAASSVSATFAADAAKPDLVVTSLSWTPASPVAGSGVTFTATVKNQGTAATPAGVKHGVAFLIDGTEVSWSDTDTASLAAGASVILTATGGPKGTARWAATGGTHTVQAYIDDSHLIAESNETNNTRNKSLTVGTRTGPDLVVTALSWTPNHPAAGGSVLFKATIKNQGTTPTPAGVIHGVGFLVDGTNVAFSDSDTTSLAAGVSTTLTANGSSAGPASWPATRGKHTVTAWVDDQNRIAESNESNNTASLPLTVYRSSAPAAVTISTGTLRAGTVNSLITADGANYQVNSTSSGTRTTTWSATVANIPNTTSGLQVTYKGSDSLNASQTLSVFNYATNAWVTAKTSTAGPAAVTSIVVPTGAPADYVSGTSGNGSVKVRLKTINPTASFYTSGDRLSVGYL